MKNSSLFLGAMLASSVLLAHQPTSITVNPDSSITTISNTDSMTQSERDIIIIDLEQLQSDHWSAQELDNAKMVVDFVQNIMNNHDFDYIRNTYGAHPYMQHNRNIPDGIEGLLGYIGGFAKRFPEYTYDVKHIQVDGNLVTIHSQATINKKHRGNDKKGFNIMDTWRIENGQFVEHWDAVQPIDGMSRFIVWLNGGKIRNGNGLY